MTLLWGSVVHRPYVYAFFVVFFFFAVRQLGVRGAAAFAVMAWTVAFLAEYSSTRNGFPFGKYVYFDETRTRELWVSNVPFWDSLSFVFLSYFSWNLAAAVLSPCEPERAMGRFACAPVAGFLMMLLDVVIDPVALRGERWFLGKIYEYPKAGPYFGVTLENFVGWFLVGSFIVWLAQRFLREPRVQGALFARGVLGVYAGVLAFNLGMTAWIGEWGLLAASAAVSALTLFAVGRRALCF